MCVPCAVISEPNPLLPDKPRVRGLELTQFVVSLHPNRVAHTAYIEGGWRFKCEDHSHDGQDSKRTGNLTSLLAMRWNIQISRAETRTQLTGQLKEDSGSVIDFISVKGRTTTPMVKK